jgi:hypothetical protein
VVNAKSQLVGAMSVEREIDSVIDRMKEERFCERCHGASNSFSSREGQGELSPILGDGRDQAAAV